MVLAADEREALAKLEQQRAKIVQQTALELPLRDVHGRRQELEIVRILEQLAGEVRLRTWKRLGEVRRRPAGAFEQSAVDLVRQDRAAPAVLRPPDGRTKSSLRAV